MNMSKSKLSIKLQKKLNFSNNTSSFFHLLNLKRPYIYQNDLQYQMFNISTIFRNKIQVNTSQGKLAQNRSSPRKGCGSRESKDISGASGIP